MDIFCLGDGFEGGGADEQGDEEECEFFEHVMMRSELGGMSFEW